MSPRALPLALSLALLALSHSAQAQEAPVIYRGVDAQGKTVFSSNPKDMRNPKKVELSAPMLSGVDPYPVAAPALGASPAPAASKASAPAEPEPGALSLPDALERLAAAKKAQAEGLEPRPGERTGTANGGTRLNPSYDARQRELAAQVQAAQRALDSATR